MDLSRFHLGPSDAKVVLGYGHSKFLSQTVERHSGVSSPPFLQQILLLFVAEHENFL